MAVSKNKRVCKNTGIKSQLSEKITDKNYSTKLDYSSLNEKPIDFLWNKKYNKNVLNVKQKVGVIDGCKDGKTNIGES